MNSQGNLIFVAFLLFTSVLGHSVMTNIIVNGVVQTSCVRPQATSRYDYPISDIKNPSGLQSSAMTCGWTGKTPNSASKCSVPAGSTVGFQWHYTDNLSDKAALAADNFFIDPSHKGPCLAYMARSDTGTGQVWFKIYENGYDTSSKQFCVDKLRANKGIFEVKIPNDLAPGNYIIRAELIALHEGFQVGGAQPYIHCAELTITGSGSSVPSTNLVSFPGAYQANDPGIYFNIYNGIKSYPIPGPPIYVSGSVPSSTSTTGKATPSTTGKLPASTTGKVPASTTNKPAGSTTTTGRSSSSGRATTGRITQSTTIATPTPAPNNGACSVDGHMICSSDSSYKTCAHGVWSDSRPCQSGTRCSASGNYIYCM